MNVSLKIENDNFFNKKIIIGMALVFVIITKKLIDQKKKMVQHFFY